MVILNKENEERLLEVITNVIIHRPMRWNGKDIIMKDYLSDDEIQAVHEAIIQAGFCLVKRCDHDNKKPQLKDTR